VYIDTLAYRYIDNIYKSYCQRSVYWRLPYDVRNKTRNVWC